MPETPSSLPMSPSFIQLISNRPTLFIALPLILSALWIGFTATALPATTNGSVSAPQEGFLSPDFTLKDLEGQAYQLSSFRGLPVLVNFWTSWCPPCRKEMPSMQEVYTEYQDRGFTILAVNAANLDRQADTLAFIQNNEITFPILLDLDGSTTRQFQVHSFPTSFFIDSNGIIQEVFIGGPMSEALLRSRIENLISGDR